MDAVRVEERTRELLKSDFKCAESVLQAFAEEMRVASPLIPRLASGFCSGIARSGGLCGAVSGGIMALGLACGRDRPDAPIGELYDKVQRFQAAFKKEYGSLNCRELTDCDLATAEGRKAFVERGMPEKCLGFSIFAAGTAMRIADGV